MDTKTVIVLCYPVQRHGELLYLVSLLHGNL